MDRGALQPTHAGLADKGLPPGKHLVDAGSVDADQLVISARDRDVELIGPTPKDNQWQARTEGAFHPAGLRARLGHAARDLPGRPYQPKLGRRP